MRRAHEAIKRCRDVGERLGLVGLGFGERLGLAGC